jgi:hypothetical protein
MNRILIAALLLSLPALAQDYAGDDELSWQTDAPPPPPDDYDQPQGPTLDDFRNDRELSWAGEWMDTPEYGPVWRPTSVDSDWRPYLYGHWEWTTVGWAWVSEEPFGWAVYHYGRWAYVGSWGWVWLPGRIWGPAWVAWRWGNGYAGWCPLGPRLVVWEQPSLWVFVGANHFLDPVRHHVIPWSETPVLYQGARALPIQRGPHAGPIASAVARVTGHALRPMPIREASSPRATGGGGGVWYYRPRSAPVAMPAGGQRPHAQVSDGGAPRRPIYFGGVPAPGIIEKNKPHANGGAAQPNGGAPHATSGAAPASGAAPHAQGTSQPAPKQESGTEHKPHAR